MGRKHHREPGHVERVKRHRGRTRATESWLGFVWKDVKALHEDQKGLCYYCNRPFQNDYSRSRKKRKHRSVHTAIFHLEHKEPLSRGGSNRAHNICLACPRCNMDKGTMTAQEFFHWRRRRGQPAEQVVITRKRGSGDERRVSRPLAGKTDQTTQPPGVEPAGAASAA